MLRLSIIIPFYNVEKYIAECLDSVFDQDIPLEEYEVICVNDGSPDHSRDIVLDYMKRYPNLRLVEHDHNRKLGAARNTGRSAAKGTYIWNVDSDDKIAPNCLGEILKVCEENKLDVYRFSCYHFLCESDNISQKQIWSKSPVVSGVQFWRLQGINNIAHIAAVWDMVIRREFLNKNNIFSLEINMGEDVPFTYKVLYYAEKIFLSNAPYYRYRINEYSLTNSNNQTLKPIAIFEHIAYCARAIFELSEECREKDIAMTFRNVSKYICDTSLEQISYLSSHDYKKLRKLYLTHLREIHYLVRLLGWRKLISFLCFLCGFRSL